MPPAQLQNFLPPPQLNYSMANYRRPETPAMHKVYILDCKSCGKFLTNRGMKVSLLIISTNNNSHQYTILDILFAGGSPSATEREPLFYGRHAAELLRL